MLAGQRTRAGEGPAARPQKRLTYEVLRCELFPIPATKVTRACDMRHRTFSLRPSILLGCLQGCEAGEREFAQKDAASDRCGRKIGCCLFSVAFCNLSRFSLYSARRLGSVPGETTLAVAPAPQAGRELPCLPRPGRHEVGQREEHLNRSRKARGQRARNFRLHRLPHRHQGLSSPRQSGQSSMLHLPHRRGFPCARQRSRCARRRGLPILPWRSS